MPHHAIQLKRSDLSSGPAEQDAAAKSAASPTWLDQLPGRSEWYVWHGQRIHYRVVGTGSPVILVHSIDVGASCFEWRMNLEAIGRSFAAFAVDLPGFGLSDIRNQACNAEMYEQFLTEFLAYLSDRQANGTGLRAIGSGTSASYLAYIARRTPSLISRMVLSCPTGLSVCHPHMLSGLAYHALGLPLVSSFSASSTTRTAIHEHLQHDVYADDTHASMNEADARYWVAHRPNAQLVERARASGLLNADIRRIVPAITQPVMVVWGRAAACPPVGDAELWRDMRPSTPMSVFERSGACPHAEEPNRFNDLAQDFLTRDLMSIDGAAVAA